MTTTKIIDSVVLYAKRQRVCIGRVDRSMEARWAGRFAELATADGLKMHRSFWVARDAVVVAERNGGKYDLKLRWLVDGGRVGSQAGETAEPTATDR